MGHLTSLSFDPIPCNPTLKPIMPVPDLGVSLRPQKFSSQHLQASYGRSRMGGAGRCSNKWTDMDLAVCLLVYLSAQRMLCEHLRCTRNDCRRVDK